MIRTGIVGSTGYVAGELIRCLVNHPEVEIDFLYSHSSAGQAAIATHDDLVPFPELKFTTTINPDVDVLFLCSGHGHSRKFLSSHSFSDRTRIIDLGNDFRLEKDADFKGMQFIYGLVEANKPRIRKAQYIANPGCFATAIQLAILPLAKAGILRNDVHIHALTGSTGAGKGLSETTHFSWRNNNVSIYKAFRHQHLGEINETIRQMQPEFHPSLHFLPLRGDFTRGIFASVYLESELPREDLETLFTEYYADEPFSWIYKDTVHLKQVVNTNNCFLQVQKIDQRVLVTSVIDNLLKGAAGQAIQNMNLMCELDETTGLHFKPSYF